MTLIDLLSRIHDAITAGAHPDTPVLMGFNFTDYHFGVGLAEVQESAFSRDHEGSSSFILQTNLSVD